jgi:hypothetical protein
MTKLFNLQSYIECCQYAHLFNQVIENLIPATGNLATIYKTQLIDKTEQHPYLQQPIININLTENLSINPNNLNYILMGTELTQGEKQRLFIIGDTVDLMTLNSNLGYQDSYLYSSAYHYWNHYQEIQKYQITKPLIFIDLDSFGTSKLVPISLSQAEDSPYKIPTLNTIDIKDINYDYLGIYNNICQGVARHILLNYFPLLAENQETLNYLSIYLQKHNFFHLLQSYIQEEYLDLILEISKDNQTYYKQVSLSISQVAHIVYQQINFKDLQTIANSNPGYQFVLISQYNIFQNIQENLPQFICLNPQVSEFQEIWYEKQQSNFPLFAIYLDDIEFAVKINNQKQWIKLSEQRIISYEGKEIKLRGYISDLNQYDFGIPVGIKSANLPIKVNDADYCVNSIPQDYQVEIQNYQGNDEVRFTIDFVLKPGSFPELKITDLQGRYRIKASFVERRENKVSYSYIPVKRIISNRQEKVELKLNTFEDNQQIKELILEIKNLISRLKFSQNINNEENLENINIKLKNMNLKLDNNLLEYIYITSNNNLDILTTHLENPHFNKLMDITYELLRKSNYTRLGRVQNNFLNLIFVFIGRLYNFAKYLQTNNLDTDKFNEIFRINKGRGSEYLQCLARIATTEKRQKNFFNSFDDYYQLQNSKYLWGYGRILLWYYSFEQQLKFIHYQENFISIMEYLLIKSSTNLDYGYKQNAFLSLIYLLTFREHDSTFCQPDSVELTLAKEVCEHFKNDRIILNTISREKTLNKYFQELIEGCATAEDIENIIQA